MSVANDEIEALGEQRPGVEPVPGLVDLGGDAELGFALLEELADLAAGPAQEAEFEPVELPPDLVEMRNEQRQVDRMRQARTRSAPTSPLLNEEASERAPAAASKHCFRSGCMRWPSSVSCAAGRSRRNRSPPSSASVA